MKQLNQTVSKKSGGSKARQTKKFSMNTSALRTAALFLCFSVLGFFIYSNTLDSPFIFDDKIQIKDNTNIRITELNFENLLKAGSNENDLPRMRPVGYITFALNYYFHQYDVKGYHIINIIIHVLTGIILYAFIKTTLSLPSIKVKESQAYAIGIFAALLWLVHPLQTQSVTYVMQRLNSLSAMFYVLSFWLYLKGRIAAEKQKKWPWFTGSVLAWLLALGSKQIAASLPFFVFLYEWYFFQNCRAGWLKRNLKYLVLLVLLFGLIALLYIGFNPVEKMESIGDYSRKEFTVLQRAITQPRVIIHYLSLIFFPHPSRLNLDYDFPLSFSLINPVTTLISLGAIISLLALAFYLAKRERLISFCILWFLGNLAIESSVIPLALIYEHRNYLPSMMVCLIPVVLIFRYIKFDWIKVGLLIILVIGLSVWTYQRNGVWESALTLWTDVVKKSPNKARPHLYLGNSNVKFGKTTEAIEHFKEAVRIKPNYPEPLNNLGVMLEKQDNREEAVHYYQKALEIWPRYDKAHNNLGKIFFDNGHTDRAIEHYTIALSGNPQNAKAQFNMGVAMAETGNLNKAVSHFQEVLKLDPGHAEAHYNLAIVLEQQGKIDNASII